MVFHYLTIWIAAAQRTGIMGGYLSFLACFVLGDFSCFDVIYEIEEISSLAYFENPRNKGLLCICLVFNSELGDFEKLSE